MNELNIHPEGAIPQAAPSTQGAPSPRPLQVGDMVRVLPIVKDLHQSNEHPWPGVTVEMVGMIGELFPIAEVINGRDGLVVDVDEWLMRPEWVELVRPIAIEPAPQATKGTSPKLIPLSEDLKYWRAESPDEWIMDRFIKKAEALEALVALSNVKGGA